jgi:hypothetical protein
MALASLAAGGGHRRVPEQGYRVAIDSFGRHSADLDRREALARISLDRC